MLAVACATGCEPVCQTGPILPVTPTPAPKELCLEFMKMIERERPADAPALSVASQHAKYRQCIDFNESLRSKDAARYKEIADCAKVQPWPVNWAVCGFKIE